MPKREAGERVRRTANLACALGLMLGSAGFLMSWTPSVAGNLSGSGAADLVVAFGPHLDGVPPALVGWAVFTSLIASGVALVALGVRDGVGALLAFLSLLVLLVFACGVRSVAHKSAHWGWWICVLGCVVGIVAAAGVWRWPIEHPGRDRWALVAVGVVIVVLSGVAILGGANRRALGARSPEGAARSMVLAAYDSDPYQAVRVLDPQELREAAQLFSEVGPKLSWLASLKGVLGGTETPTGVITSATARSDGSVGVKIVGLRYDKPAPSSTTPTTAKSTSVVGGILHKLGVRQRPTLIMVQRNGHWFVSGSASIREASASILGGLG